MTYTEALLYNAEDSVVATLGIFTYETEAI